MHCVALLLQVCASYKPLKDELQESLKDHDENPVTAIIKYILCPAVVAAATAAAAAAATSEWNSRPYSVAVDAV
jgi:hypothetical protein